jgi:hypothetical protein
MRCINGDSDNLGLGDTPELIEMPGLVERIMRYAVWPEGCHRADGSGADVLWPIGFVLGLTAASISLTWRFLIFLSRGMKLLAAK